MRGLKALLAVPVLTAAWWVVLPVAQAGAGDITNCPGTLDGTTYTLTADCPPALANFGLSVEPGLTIDGAGHTITVDTNFQGAVISNRTGSPITLRNLKVQGTNLVNGCVTLTGVLLTDTDATITNVEVHGMVRPATAGCQTGLGMRVISTDGTPRTVNVSGFKTSDFQKAGLVASGTVTVNVSNSTIGPPTLLTGQVAQNSVQYGGLVPGGGGTFSHNTVIGAGSGRTDAGSTAMLLFGANDLVIRDNTITGAGTDTGIDVEAALGGIPSTNVTIENNHIERTSALPVAPTPSGEGIFVDGLSLPTTTVICNVFNGWNTNLSGVTQPPCITTNPSLPNGRIGSAYSMELAATSEPPGGVTWQVTAGALPPGLALNPDGTITGTPTTEGTFTFTATVTDAVGLAATRDFTIIVTAAISPPNAGSNFTPLSPARIVDTRNGLGGVTGPLQGRSTSTFTATGVGGVPATGVTAVVLNVAADLASAPGFIQLFPTGNGAPGGTSSLNVDHAGQTIANLVIVGVNASGQFSVFTHSSTHLVVDVFGYFTAVPESTSGRLVTIDPVRVLDTRSGEGRGGVQGPVPAQGTVAVSMAGAIPVDASAVVMTLTGDQALAPGYIQAIPTGGATPLRSSSNINLDRAGDTMPNTVIIPLGADGTVTLFTQSGANLVVDVVGYFTGASDASSTTGLFIPITPTRVADTRVGGIVPAGVVASGATLQVPFRASPPLVAIPPSAVAGNLTATDTTASGYVQLIPTGTSTPVGATSTLNINGPDRIVAAANVLSGVTGSITVHNQSATNLVYDVTGLFL
jgi:Putative Ig domain/Right handed beta helix region